MIKIKNLSKLYGKTTAVDGLDLTISKGEIFGFIGPNGAGKTTTIQMLAGGLAPSSGEVMVDGISMTENPTSAKLRIGYIPDRPYLYEKLTAIEFLSFTGEMYQMEQSGFEALAEGMLDRFGLKSWADELIESFSHGMKQRLIMAAALIHEPRVIVVDEPMVGLDPSAIKMVRGLFKDLAEKGTTIFMSTHTLHIAENLCHRLGVIHRGRLIALGSIEELKEKAHSEDADLEQVFMILTENSYQEE